MTQRELIYIKTVADEKSISQAAKKLFIAQPSLSQYIKRIEDSLGTPLFNRAST
ncbi:LysR family transcriptional regulator, partial [[Clostridium] symbiosum]